MSLCFSSSDFLEDESYYDEYFSDDPGDEGTTTDEEEDEHDEEEVQEAEQTVDDGDGGSTHEEDDQMAPSEEFQVGEGPAGYRRRRQARAFALGKSLSSGMYPVFHGTEGPTERMDPQLDSALDYVQKLWPLHLCELIAQETNKYALQRGTAQRTGSRRPTTAEEIWTFLGMVLAMSFKVLSRLNDYWSLDTMLGVPSIANCMPRDRFKFLLRHLHLVDETSLSSSTKEKDRHYKVRPLLTILRRSFMLSYSPSQEFVVDELMIKAKGRAKGKVYMPKKPIKRGFKLWGLSCSCCGYLCNFQLYAGKCTKNGEKGLVKRVVLDLVEPYAGLEHVVYLDNYFTSLDLALRLADMGIGIVGTAKGNCEGLPDGLKGKLADLDKGDYLCIPAAQGKVNFYAYNDRKLVRFITNVFPASMPCRVPVRQSSGVLVSKHVPPLLPAYNKYMGAVDRTGQLRKYYGFDRKVKRPWLRIFFNLFDLAVNNAHILYRHSCKESLVRPKDLLEFRVEIAHILLDGVCGRARKRTASQALNIISNPSPESCRLVHVNETDLKRGRCFHCLQTKKKAEQRTTRFCCSYCKVRLCKTGCYDAYHRH